MLKGLIAVMLSNGDVVCPDCSERIYPSGIPDDATPVFEHDDWKGDVSGNCAGEGCLTFIDPARENP